jgi:hypothetical protein
MLAILPNRLANALLVACNKIAHGRPALADTIVSVWRKNDASR